MYSGIILRILTVWSLMKSAFSAVESKRKRVTLARNFIARDFPRIMKIAIDHYIRSGMGVCTTPRRVNLQIMMIMIKGDY